MRHVLHCLKGLSHELAELDFGATIDHLYAPVSPLEFYREYVAPNKPCVIHGAIDHWEALTKWTPEYLKAAVGHVEVTVDFTPNGKGDAVTTLEQPGGSVIECFATPDERNMPLSHFLDLFYQTKSGSAAAAAADDDADAISIREIPYLQHQQDNLRQQLPELIPDVEPHFSWFTEALGCPPDAANIWIGDDRSTTSFHKDHYENLYAVVAGTKVFTLLPPSAVYRMHLKRYPTAKFTPDATGRLIPVLNELRQEVMWCPVDPQPGAEELAAAQQQYPLYFDPSLPPPLRVEVGPGDVLYLPAMWYHHVGQLPDEQHQWVVAVNFWHDMRFDVKYGYFRLLEELCSGVGLMPAGGGGGEEEEQEQGRQQECH